ncbi:MAG: Nucleoside triphosphate pyrophosphohydrolase [Syntrophus sp. PtaU1.Bin208]|nr:MAG: Nucleoside triphosphate pyrophosphohydrolase [Syntrophus sp. PtaU1.Bin208]
MEDFSLEQRFTNLRDILRRLRSPEGCLWDRQQTKGDIGRYLLDESYEVLDAIASGSPAALREELGDLLFQILFLAQIAEEDGEFGIDEVLDEIGAKMIRRHPHVFGDREVKSVADIKANWEEIKRTEEKKYEKHSSLLDKVPRSMPALMRAQKISALAAKVGFDWPNAEEVLAKIEEEFSELKAAIQSGQQRHIEEETGDLFFSLVNLCRFFPMDAEQTLARTILKFSSRFFYIEEKLKERGTSPAEATLEEMDRLWNEAKLKLKE